MSHRDRPRLDWRKASYSGDQGSCVEIARDSDAVAVRDSKNPDGPALRFNQPAFRALIARVRAGNHNL